MLRTHVVRSPRPQSRRRLLCVLAVSAAFVPRRGRRRRRCGRCTPTRWRASRRSARRWRRRRSAWRAGRRARGRGALRGASSGSTRRAATATTRCGRRGRLSLRRVRAIRPGARQGRRRPAAASSSRRRTRRASWPSRCRSSWRAMNSGDMPRAAGRGHLAIRRPRRDRRRDAPPARRRHRRGRACRRRTGVDTHRHASRTSAASCCPTPCASPSSSTPRWRSTRAHPGSGARVRRPARHPRVRRAHRSDAPLRGRRRHRPAGPRRPASEQHHAHRARRRGRHRATACTRSTARTGW